MKTRESTFSARQEPDANRAVAAFDENLALVCSGTSLSAAAALEMMELIIAGIVPEEKIEQYLVALAAKKESVEELVGSAIALRRHCVPFHTPHENIIDNCGTGGDGAGTFNISTVASLVIAASGQPVVKHGNRSASGRVGSADLLEHWGISVNLPLPISLQCLQRFNFAFLFAPQYHPTAKSVAAIRKKIGRPTIFNLLGPLCNPATPPYQLLGVPNVGIAEKMAGAILQLGIRRAFVITSGAGVDELLPGENHVLVIEAGRIRSTKMSGAEAGFPKCTLKDLQGGDVRQNAAIAAEILSGAQGPARDTVVFNAAAALVCTAAEADIRTAVERCSHTIDAGLAKSLLENLQQFSRESQVSA